MRRLKCCASSWHSRHVAERAPASAPPRRWLATLLARFDNKALRVELPGRPGVPTVKATPGRQWAPLQAWCFRGAGDGGSPLWQPTRASNVELRFSVGVWPEDAQREQPHLIEAFSRHLDGSDQLAARGTWSGRLLRLRVKAREGAWWRRRRLSDPWDCGYVLNEPTARQALSRFEPRRATLVVAVAWPADALIEAIVEMAHASSRFAHPVRWLVVASAGKGTDDIGERLRSLGLPAQRLQPRADET